MRRLENCLKWFTVFLILVTPLFTSPGQVSAAKKEIYITLSGEKHRYVGEVKNGVPNGKGISYFPNGKKSFEGKFVAGRPHEGKRYNSDGKLYSDISNGQGKIYYPNGKFNYVGKVDKETWLPSGKGTEYDINGTVKYKGDFLNGSFHGQGKWYTEYGEMFYQGTFKNGLPQGQGKAYQYGEIAYVGAFDKGVPTYSGKIKLYEDGVIIYDGQAKNGAITGKGKGYLNGKLVYVGMFKNGRPTGEGKFYTENSSDGPNISIYITVD
ncbi:hypothetical protein BS614_01025 [Paenibacillus xylanexedens]|uniref:hypothetical protein n=1 Tax=Paenibacillus xylanexedens TaxID=528191 RepID=UPI00093864FA|nr:hypothetical protein [Paenibacillus xylanexedens]APO42803.1 hypothetical protein BS614_01025 [Paenibacillus xylanexedens]